jgi:hypothetical protein
MKNQKNSIKKALDVVSFLHVVGHPRLWITRF